MHSTVLLRTAKGAPLLAAIDSAGKRVNSTKYSSGTRTALLRISGDHTPFTRGLLPLDLRAVVADPIGSARMEDQVSKRATITSSMST